MADAPILGGSKKLGLDDAAFGVRFNGQLVHESVRAELNARRQGTASTKDAFALLGKWGAPASTLLVLTDEQEFASRSFRNLDKVRVAPVSAVGVTDLIRASRLLITEDALEAITARALRVPRKQESAA